MIMAKDKTGLEESLNMTEMLLVYISKNEPMDRTGLLKLVEGAKIDPDKLLLNLGRLKDANLIDYEVILVFGEDFPRIYNVKLTYNGLKEIDSLLKRKNIVKGMELNFGLLKIMI